MAAVAAGIPVSLDGFVADPSGGTERIFAWCSRPQPGRARCWRGRGGMPGRDCLQPPHLRGRLRLGRQPPGQSAVIVVTHSVPDAWPQENSTMSFVTGGIRAP
jgi:hypothetical protein